MSRIKPGDQDNVNMTRFVSYIFRISWKEPRMEEGRVSRGTGEERVNMCETETRVNGYRWTVNVRC